MTYTLAYLLLIVSPLVVISLDEELPKYKNLEVPIETSVLEGDKIRERSNLGGTPEVKNDVHLNSEQIKNQEFVKTVNDVHTGRPMIVESNPQRVSKNDEVDRRSSDGSNTQNQPPMSRDVNDQHMKRARHNDDSRSQPNDNFDRKPEKIPTHHPVDVPVDRNRAVNDDFRPPIHLNARPDTFSNEQGVYERGYDDAKRENPDYHKQDHEYKRDDDRPNFDPRNHPRIPDNIDRIDPIRPNARPVGSHDYPPDPYVGQGHQRQPPMDHRQIPHQSAGGNRHPHPENIFLLPSVNTEQNNMLLGNTLVSVILLLFPAMKQCIYYTPLSDFVIDYQVIRGGMLDMGILIKDPNGEPIIAQPPSTDDTFSIKVPPHFHMRSYAICLDNRKTSYAEKYVSLNIDVDINWDNPSLQDQALIDYIQKRSFGDSTFAAMDEQFTENTKALTTVLDKLFVRLRHIQSMQKKTDTLATVDKSLMEANLDRVLRGSLTQMLMLIAVCSVQVLLIRALFDPYSRLYRIWWGKRSHISARFQFMASSDVTDEEEDRRWKVATEAGKKFSSLFYRAFDKKDRPDLPGFYMENVILLWNGNRVEGRQLVLDWLNKLPGSSTTLHSVSAQPVHKSLSGDRLLVMVNVFGAIKFEQNRVHQFSETFFLAEESKLWRVQSATFRFID